jgi:adenosylcobinamide-phosphate synthase
LNNALYILPAALLLDLFLGDPRWLPHPIIWMGRAIERLEPVFRRRINNLIVSGALFAVSLVGTVWLLAWVVLKIAWHVHPFWGGLIETVLIFYCISIRSLRDAALMVKRTLEQGTVEQARDAVARIVGRDTRYLDRVGIGRATVETVAENLVDGVISPLFYTLIGGAPLALAFKMTNTLDSMIGYKNETYIEFGRAAARLDDLANYIPARLSVPIIALAAQVLFRRGRASLKTAIRQGRAHTSPNAGLPEAAFAGALGVQLGGPNRYGGIRIDKPFIGQGLADVQQVHITGACRLMVLSSIMWAGLLWTVQLVF